MELQDTFSFINWGYMGRLFSLQSFFKTFRLFFKKDIYYSSQTFIQSCTRWWNIHCTSLSVMDILRVVVLIWSQHGFHSSTRSWLKIKFTNQFTTLRNSMTFTHITCAYDVFSTLLVFTFKCFLCVVVLFMSLFWPEMFHKRFYDCFVGVPTSYYIVILYAANSVRMFS